MGDFEETCENTLVKNWTRVGGRKMCAEAAPLTLRDPGYSESSSQEQPWRREGARVEKQIFVLSLPGWLLTLEEGEHLNRYTICQDTTEPTPGHGNVNILPL